ncbi:MAG: site-specific integrase [Ktedonobacteraceae bacterium]
MGKRGNGEGSIYKQRNGLWAASLSIEGGKRKYFYGKTRKEVQEKLAAVLQEQKQGMLVATPQQTVGQFLTDWLENTHKQSVRPRTYERYEEALRLHLLPVLGKYQLQKLSAQHVQAFYARKLKEGLASTTVIYYHSVLHNALDTAVKWGLVARNVCDLVTPPRKTRFEIKPFTIEQVQSFFAAIQGHKWEALFTLALATGMRQGELLGLKWQDINFSTGTLQVRRILTRVPSETAGKVFIEAEPKTEKSRRSITIALFALEALKQHRVHQLETQLKAGALWEAHDYIFCTLVGTHLRPSHVVDEFKKLLKKADLPDTRFHDLRHSAATLLLGLGVHAKVVQEMLGHTQMSMTMDIYSHVLPTMQQDAVSKLNALLMRREGGDMVKDG